MPDFNDDKAIESQLRVYLKDDPETIDRDEKISQLKKKKRKQGLFLIINVLAIVFFSYSFFYGITRLSDTVLYVLFAVFIVNSGLLLYQRQQIGSLMDYVKQKPGEA